MSSRSGPAEPHTKVTAPVVDGDVQVELIPLFGDNYSYLLLHAATKTAALVDPADPAPIQRALAKHADYKLHTILTTHKHWDHAGGNLELKKVYPDVQIVGGTGDGVDGATLELGTGDSVHVGDAFKAHVFQCPCHTRGHIIFKVGQLLFTGDTLFSAGCGKFFEGNASEMYTNMYKTIGVLADSTIIMPGHEYTVSNLEFATWVEPDNAAITERLQWAKQQRAQQAPTVPSTLAQEKSWNPFLRVHEAAVQARVSRVLSLNADNANAAGEELGIKVMGALRTLKDENAHKKKE